MKTYQSQLPVSRVIQNPRPPLPPRPETPPKPRSEDEIRELIKFNVEAILLNGFWYCDSHDGICEIIESDHGQPRKCASCGSHKISWNPPIDQRLVPDEKLIEPQDLAETLPKGTIV